MANASLNLKLIDLLVKRLYIYSIQNKYLGLIRGRMLLVSFFIPYGSLHF